MKPVIVAYFTANTIYEDHAKNFIRSAQEFNVPYEVTPIKSMGDWYANMQWKPTFINDMMMKHYPRSVVYVDIDAVFFKSPVLFDELDQDSSVHIGVHLLDHSKRRRSNHSLELLSGTVYLKNTVTTQKIVREWIKACKASSTVWDQVALSHVLHGGDYSYYILPEEYCTIFDYMADVKEPVIKHYQASRTVKGATPLKKRKKVHAASIPDVVDAGSVKRHPATSTRSGGVTRIGRKHRH